MSTKFKPILFSTEMVQAIIEGRKTQTRRALKYYVSDQHPLRQTAKWMKDNSTCPYGNINDVLWVRECYCIWDDGTFKYKTQSTCDTYGWKDTMIDKGIKWKPSIHMPKSACRLFLKIKDVRVERLQDISKADAWAEGVKEIEKNEAYFDYMNEAGSYATAKGSFFSLWKSINGEDSFDANPWVWVIEFERVEKPTNF